MIDLEEAEKLGKAATPAPWRFVPPDEGFPEGLGKPTAQEIATDEWLVFARNHWSEIIAELRELRDTEKVVDELQNEVDRLRAESWDRYTKGFVRLSVERVEAQKLVMEWRAAFAKMTNDPTCSLDHFHSVLDQTEEFSRKQAEGTK